MRPRLRNALPPSPINDAFDVASSDPEAFTYGMKGQPVVLAKFTDNQDISLGEFGTSVSAGCGPCAMANLVSLVFLRCCPPKIGRAVVKFIPVPMRDQVTFRWPHAMKCQAYDYVDRRKEFWSEANFLIFVASKRPQHNTWPEASAGNPPIHRSHAPKAGCLVAWVSRHWTPFFRFGYRVISHIALLRRVVRVWRRGERLSSVPQFSGALALQQAGSFA